MQEKKVTLIATAAAGVEAVVARELKHLGYEDAVADNGKISFNATISAVCRTNLWLRSADRVYLKMGEFNAESFEELFEGTKALPWEEWLTQDAQFPVTGKCVKSKLMSMSDCQSIIKKAVVERLKIKYKLVIFPETGPRYKIEFSIFKDKVLIMIDSSGDGLHKRGYRKLVTKAPLKETLACALLMISRWKNDRALIDPFCGSGTIPIEAAMMAMNMAPGLNRSFDAQYWRNVSMDYWDKAIEEALDLLDKDTSIRIQGSDIDPEAIKIARYHAELAEVGNKIHLQRLDMRDISSRFKYGFVVTNPPYGERLGDEMEIKALYADLHRVLAGLDTWSWYILSSYPEFERVFGKKADKNRKLYNGNLLCYYYQFFGPKPANMCKN